MNDLKKITGAGLLIITLCMAAAAQQNQEPSEIHLVIHTLVRSYGDSIVIRWAPADAALWLLGNRYGYRVTRHYLKDSVIFSDVLTSQPVKPWSLEQMMRVFAPDDSLAAIAAQAVHGKEFGLTGLPDGSDSFMDALMKTHREQQMRFAFAAQSAEFSPAVANALGLRFADRNVEPGVIYEYVVESLIPDEYVRVNPGREIIRCTPYRYAGDTIRPDYIQSGPQQVEIMWPRNACSAFFIERSSDTGRSWQPLNSQPFYSSQPDQNPDPESESITSYYHLLQDNHLYHDSIEPGITYLYRIRGIDAFSDLSPWSEPMEVTLADIIPPAPVLLLIPEIIDNMSVRLSWHKELIEPDLAGYYIQHAVSINDPFVEIHQGLLPPETTNYIDDDAAHRGTGYYRIFAVDNSGNQSVSHPVLAVIEDTNPPSAPTGIAGAIYGDAIAEILWIANPESDIRGYRVFYANHANHVFIPLTPRPITQTWYRDTVNINTLTRNIYYQVVAEDHSGNFSPMSEILELSRPDIIPPPVPTMLNIRQDQERVYINWAASPANDILLYRIFRKLKSSEEWELVKSVNQVETEKQISFSDTPPSASEPWQYVMEVIDQSGLSSGMGKIISFRVRGAREIDIPIHLTATYDNDGHRIMIDWSYQTAEPHFVVLYQSINDEPHKAVRSLESSVSSFIDYLSADCSSVQYYLQIHLNDGRRSKPSKTISLSVK